MPLQNRVAPTGDISALPERGTLMGNRGVLHDEHRRLGPARWRHRAWIACTLAFRDRRRPVMAPGRYTELFFLDEAVALAAGHRPCAECRRADFRRYRAAVAGLLGEDLSASEIDAHLHVSRIDPATRRQRRTVAALETLPEGTFVALAGEPHLLQSGVLLRWTPGGYVDRKPIFEGPVAVLTPGVSVSALAAGYVPLLHPSVAGTAPGFSA